VNVQPLDLALLLVFGLLGLMMRRFGLPVPLVLKLMHRSEETLLIVEDDRDQQEKAAQT
jgi:putative tricarboxylic transport membrane protein